MQATETTRTSDLNLAHLIRQQIDQQTWGRVHRLQAEFAGDQLVIHGSARSHYVKQLALKAALDVLGSSTSVAIVMNIQVGQARVRQSIVS
jgi:hypothetical protein